MANRSELPLFRVVGFSGHRQIRDPKGIAGAIDRALDEIREGARGEWVAVSSVATGSDQIFVERAVAARFSWYAILPLPRAEFQKDFSEEEWAQVNRTLDRAENIRVITENGTREDAYLDCGMETANGADILVAVWDGEPARGKGGTADVVDYARSIGKPLIIIDAHTCQLRKEHWEKLEKDDPLLEHLNRLPDATTGYAQNPFNAPDSIFGFQQKCDHAASRGAPQFRRLIASTVLLHVGATLVASLGLAYAFHPAALPWIKLACLVGALLVAVVLHRHAHSHDSWVRCRLAAEFCRSALATWGLPRAAPLFNELDLPGVRGITRSLHVLHSRSSSAKPVPMDTFKTVYLSKRIDDQLAYYRRQEGRALPLFKRLKAGFWIATLLALLCTAAYAVAHTMEWEVSDPIKETLFYFAPIALPVVAASFISFISINDLQRRVARYREMCAMLEDSRRQITFCQTWNSLERLVLKTERALLQEVLEWHSITSFSESH